MKYLKRLVKQLLYKNKASSDTYITHLREIGVKIGENVDIFNPIDTIIDEQYPWMISIGDNVKITDGVKILTHDFSWSVIKNFNYPHCDGRILGASGSVVIGNNVFIGMDSIITRNVSIGDNVVIGAHSVVTHDCESDYVYAGNPAKKIMSLCDYIEKREKMQIMEAKNLALGYFRRFNTLPPIDIFFEYFVLFMPVDEINNNKKFLKQMKLGNSYKQSLFFYRNYNRPFFSFKDFLDYCLKKS